jgi:hypothetical protein
MIDALIKRVSVTYQCYEMYAHREKKVQLLVFSDRSRNGRQLINYGHCLRGLPNRKLISIKTDKISQQLEHCENRNNPDLVQAFLKKWW